MPPLERFSSLVETIAGLFLALITVTIFVSALGRYLFAAPIPDGFDLARLLLGVTVMWGFACVGYRGSHIQVDLLAEALPAPLRRWIDAFAWALLLLFTVLLAWKLSERALGAWRSGEATFDLRLPVWPFMAVIWLGAAVSVITVTARLAQILRGTAPAAHGYDQPSPDQPA